MKFIKLIEQIDQVLVKDRESLSERDKLVLNDCKELAKICLKENDRETVKIHTINLTLKMTVFLTNNKGLDFIKKLDNSLKS